jgi:small basic protein (TIGR04137 family)
MSVHRSLKVKEGLLRARNVWKRLERLEALKKSGKHGAEASVYGLPKVRTGFKTKKAKSDKPEKAKPVVAGAPAAAGAAPAAGAAAGGAGKAGAAGKAPAGKPKK